MFTKCKEPRGHFIKQITHTCGHTWTFHFSKHPTLFYIPVIRNMYHPMAKGIIAWCKNWHGRKKLIKFFFGW
jgi:hypothetical protein